MFRLLPREGVGVGSQGGSSICRRCRIPFPMQLSGWYGREQRFPSRWKTQFLQRGALPSLIPGRWWSWRALRRAISASCFGRVRAPAPWLDWVQVPARHGAVAGRRRRARPSGAGHPARRGCPGSPSFFSLPPPLALSALSPQPSQSVRARNCGGGRRLSAVGRRGRLQRRAAATV
jgi:hypothetical protein